MDAIPISVTILTKDSARLLREVLEALGSFDEVLIADNGSSDATLEIGRAFPNVKIHCTEFKGFGPLHNEVAALARYDWIFSVDSDEVLTPELVAELRALRLDDNCVYSVASKNFYNGKWIRWCGWYPDRKLRLYNRKRTRFSDAQVHESILTEGMRTAELRNPMNHFSYTSVADFITKTQRYSELFAQENKGRKKSSLGSAISHGATAFLKSYLLKRGFLDGREGFVICAYQGLVAYYKYLKLLEANEKGQGKPRA